MCNNHAAEGDHVPKVAKLIGKTLPKRKPKAPQADANSGSGEAHQAGPGMDASPARQTSGRNAGSPKRYSEVRLTYHVESHIAVLQSVESVSLS